MISDLTSRGLTTRGLVVRGLTFGGLTSRIQESFVQRFYNDHESYIKGS